MNRFCNYYPMCLLLASAWLASLCGVLAEADQPDTIEFSCLHWEGVPEEKLYYREGEHYRPLAFRRGARAKPTDLAGMSHFELYGDAQEAPEGEVPYVLLGKVAIPEGVKKLLFYIIVDRQEEQSHYRLFAMDDSRKAFPRGTFRFVNLTEQMLSVEFSGITKDVAADQMAVIPYKRDDKGGTFIPCIIRDDEEQTLFGTRLFGQPSGRELVIIRPSPVKGKKSLQLKFYSELIAAPLPLVQ